MDTRNKILLLAQILINVKELMWGRPGIQLGIQKEPLTNNSRYIDLVNLTVVIELEPSLNCSGKHICLGSNRRRNEATHHLAQGEVPKDLQAVQIGVWFVEVLNVHLTWPAPITLKSLEDFNHCNFQISLWTSWNPSAQSTKGLYSTLWEMKLSQGQVLQLDLKP